MGSSLPTYVPAMLCNLSVDAEKSLELQKSSPFVPCQNPQVFQIGKIEDTLKKDGDLGRAASGILSQRKQTTFLAQEVTVERVYDTLYKIANLSGSSSQERKIKYISSLLNDANPTEARFMIKLLLGTLRLGVAENTVMDGLAIAFTGEKKTDRK